MIELQNVRKAFRGRSQPVLDGVDLVVDEGEVLALRGDSGAGKTTLLELLIGAQHADDGAVRVFGRDVARLRRSSIGLLRRHLGVLPQEPKLLEERSALDNVAVPLEVRAVPRREARVRAARALADIDLATEVDRPVTQLPAGMRRRVALARALVAGPRLLLLDDPSAHLDPRGWELLLSCITRLQGDGVSAVLVGSDPRLDEAAALCGWRRAELVDGCLHEIDAAPTEDYESVDIDFDDEDEDDAVPNVVPFPVTARAGGSE